MIIELNENGTQSEGRNEMDKKCKNCGETLSDKDYKICQTCFDAKYNPNGRNTPKPQAAQNNDIARDAFDAAIECGESFETAYREAHYADIKGQGKIGYYAD